MQIREGNILLIILVAVAVLAIGIGGYFSWQKKNTTTTNFPPNYTKQIPDTKPNDPTANWKTYSDSVFGFSFKYPTDWVFTNCGQGQNQIIQLASRQLDCKQALPDTDNITIAVSPGNTISSFLADRQRIHLTTISDIQIDGVSGMDVRIEPNPNLKMPTVFSLHDVYVAKDGRTYVLTMVTTGSGSPEKIKPIYDQILSTFKFLN